MMGLAGVAEPFIFVILNEQWAFAGQLLQIICFSMMWFPVHAINLNLLQVKGRSDLFLPIHACVSQAGNIQEDHRSGNTCSHRAHGTGRDVLRCDS